MANDTRELFLDTAETLFAERGFYGVSIAAIAGELGLTKQALLHHFASKEKLYGAVLARISDRFASVGETASEHTIDPAERLKRYFIKLQNPKPEHAAQTRLLMRELLDNKRRADTASTWYLKDFLEGLIAMVKDVSAWSDAKDAEAFALIYQWLGAINYFAISDPTLTGIFGTARMKAFQKAFPAQLEQLIDASLSARGHAGRNGLKKH